jgi:hypothetical protein
MATSERIKEIEYIEKMLKDIPWDSNINVYVGHLETELKVLKQIEAKEMEVWEEEKNYPKGYLNLPVKLIDLIIDGIIEVCEITHYKGDSFITIARDNRTHIRSWLKTINTKMYEDEKDESSNSN